MALFVFIWFCLVSAYYAANSGKPKASKSSAKTEEFESAKFSELKLPR